MEIGNIFGYKFYADNIYGYKNLRKRAGNSKFKFTFLQGYEILSQPQKTLLLSLISRIKKYLMPNIISQSIRIVGQKVFLHFKLSLSFPPFFVPINFVPIICVPKNMAKFRGRRRVYIGITYDIQNFRNRISIHQNKVRHAIRE